MNSDEYKRRIVDPANRLANELERIDMAPQIDTAQRRAEEHTALATEEILDAINQLAYPGATIKRVVARVVQQTRWDALAEAVKLCRDNASISASPHTAWVCNLMADTLDRLREGAPQ